MIGPRESADENLSLSERIIQRVADAEDVSPTALAPLYEAVDPDSLDSLFSPTTTGERAQGRIVFSYNGHTISVRKDGQIDLDDPDASVGVGPRE